MISVEVSTPNSVSVDDVVNRVEVDITTTGTVGGGVTDHGTLTGLTDDDHPQYQRAEPVFTSTDPFTITDESFVLTTGSAVTLPDATSNAGRTVLVGAAAVAVTVSPAGIDSINISSGAVTSYQVLVSSGVAFTSLGAGGWVVTNEQGIVANLPPWYDVQAGTSALTDGNVLSVATVSGLSIPTWTTGTRTAEQFLSGTGWTDDVPVLVPVKNTSGGTIAKGVPVYATGTVGSTSTIEIAPADADDAAKMPAIGLTNSSLAVNATGYVTVVGTVRGVNTNAYTVNQTLYVSTTAGQLTGTKPTGTSELIQGIGRVTRVNASTGEILVLGAGRTNDIPNAIDAGKLTTGTVGTARLGTGTANSTTFLRGDGTWNTPLRANWFRAAFSDADYTVTLSGSGFIVQNGTLSATRTVTLPSLASFPAGQEIILWSGDGVSSTNKLIVSAASGQTINGTGATYEITQPNRLARFVSNTNTGNSATNPHWVAQTFNINASEITSGTVATARLGTGTASASKFLRGDQTWDHVNPAPAFLTVSGNKDYGIPGWLPTAAPGAGALSTGRLTFEPWWVWREVTIDRLAVEVTTAAAAGSLMRLGIYNCDTSWTPTSLVVDAGTIAVDPATVPAFQTVTVNVTLAPGRYMACWVTQGVPSCRQQTGAVPTWPSRIGTASASGSSVYRNSMYLANQSALVTGGLASTGTAPDTINATASFNANFIITARFV